MADLITLPEYKVIKRIPQSNVADDNTLSVLITSVSAFVESYCNRNFLDYSLDAATEYYDNFYFAPMVQLRNFPILEIVEVAEKGLSDSTYTPITNYRLDATTDSLFKIQDGRYADWASGPQAIKVTYKHGYLNTPEDLKLAVSDFVFYYFNSEYKASQSIGANVLNGAPAFSTSDLASVPGHIKRVLDMYKNVS